MNRKYILEEKLDICFEAVGYIGKRNSDERISYKFNGHILYIHNDLILYVIISEHDEVAKKRLIEALQSPINKDDYTIKKSYIGDAGNCIVLKMPGEIRFTRHDFVKGQEIVSMFLNQISFTYNGEIKESLYRLTSVCSTVIFSPTELLIYKDGNASFRSSTLNQKCCGIPFTLFKEGCHAYIKTDEIDKIFKIFSFYYCTHFEYDMVCSPEQNGNVSLLIKAPQYKASSGNSLKTIGYLLSGQNSLGNFGGFLSTTNDCTNEIWNNKFLSDYISGFIRAEYLDNISKLIIYTTILEKMTRVGIDDDTYKCIKNNLAKKKIDIRKIDDNISSKNIKNEKKDPISNFIQLRNFFVHHLGSEEAELFLKDSKMLFNLKLTITILILYQFGLTNIRFKTYFAHLSVFDECLKVGNLSKARTQKCRLKKWVLKVVKKMNFISKKNPKTHK